MKVGTFEKRGHGRRLLVACVLPVLLTAAVQNSVAETSGVSPASGLEITLGKSVVVESAVPITRASLANPAVADVVVLSPRQIYVTGAGVGLTNLTLWQAEDQVYKIYSVNVHPDLSELKSQIYDLFPEGNRRPGFDQP